MRTCNSTLENQHIDEIAYWHGYTFHEIGLAICAIFGLLAILIAGYLILRHACHYSLSTEQRHIIRILFMIPVYATVSFLSYYFYTKAIYFDVLGDCWEAFAIASFFTLMCNYLRPGLHDQKVFFRERERPKNWIWPLNWLQKCTGGQDKGIFRRPRSALTWFNIIYLCIFQYCFIRVFFTIVSVVTEAANRYCEDSLNPAFAHIWVTGFEGGSVTIAMYGLIQFYFELREDLKAHKPFLKLLCIKLVIFLSFWQTIIISFLASSSHHLITPGPRVGYQDIHVGIPALLLCIEMALFAILHLFAFPWRRPYADAVALAKSKAMTDPKYMGATGSARMASGEELEDVEVGPGRGLKNLLSRGKKGAKGGKRQQPEYFGGRFGLRALLDALNPWDIIKQTGRGFRWGFVGVRHRNDANNLPLQPHQKSTDGSVDTDASDSLAEMPLANGMTPYLSSDAATFGGDTSYHSQQQQQQKLPPHLAPPYPVSPMLSAEDEDAFRADGDMHELGMVGSRETRFSFEQEGSRRQSSELHLPAGRSGGGGTWVGEEDRAGLLRHAGNAT